jgi:hypothetical protein
MEKSEKETLLMVNAADAADGFFAVTTTSVKHYRQIVKRIGGEQNLKKLRTEKNTNGKIVFWSCEIPIRFWSKTHFGIKSEARVAAGQRKATFNKKVPSSHFTQKIQKSI